jgi:hypothetical protein
MPMRPLSADRKILIVGAATALLLCSVAVLVGTKREAGSEWPSSYATGRGGAKAAYLLLNDLGYKVERSNAPPASLENVDLPATLILAEPTHAASASDKKALQDFLRRGGRVLAVGRLAAWMLDDVRVRMGTPHLVWKTYPRVTPSAITRRARTISMSAEWYSASTDGRTVVHYSADGEDVVVSYPVGKGEVIWWASATPLTNNGIQERDNIFLFLDSVGDPGRHVVWDEYFHEGARTVSDSILSSPLKWAIIQLAVLGGFVVLTFSRRHGPIFVRRQRTRLSPLEFTDALAHLYRRAHAANVGLEVAYERFRHAAVHRLGLAGPCSAPQLGEAFEQRFGIAGVRETLVQAESLRYEHDVSERQTIELVRALHRYTMQLNGLNITQQGKN